MASLDARRIARSYLPSRYHYWYCLGKVRIDPLYEIVREALRSERAPLLDLGCGIGVLLHCLRASGWTNPYLGVDSDAAKIALAARSAARSGWSAAEFRVCDITQNFPAHRGSVALLDVLQYLDPSVQQRVLRNAARSLTDHSLLIMRGGLDDGGWRASLTRIADRFGHASGWMDASFKAQPKPDELAASLRAEGLEAEFRPAWGRTPFNNWLIVARRAH